MRTKTTRFYRVKYTPHFLFETSKRKWAVYGGKEKVLSKLAQRYKFGEYGS